MPEGHTIDFEVYGAALPIDEILAASPTASEFESWKPGEALCGRVRLRGSDPARPDSVGLAARRGSSGRSLSPLCNPEPDRDPHWIAIV